MAEIPFAFLIDEKELGGSPQRFFLNDILAGTRRLGRDVKNLSSLKSFS